MSKGFEDEAYKVQVKGASKQVTLPSDYCMDMRLEKGNQVILSYNPVLKEIKIRKMLKTKL